MPPSVSTPLTQHAHLAWREHAQDERVTFIDLTDHALIVSGLLLAHHPERGWALLLVEPDGTLKPLVHGEGPTVCWRHLRAASDVAWWPTITDLVLHVTTRIQINPRLTVAVLAHLAQANPDDALACRSLVALTSAHAANLLNNMTVELNRSGTALASESAS